MANLFQRDKSTVSRHIKNIFDEGELIRASTVAKFATVQNEGERQAEREIPMTMEDWAKHLDGILTSTGENLLTGSRITWTASSNWSKRVKRKRHNWETERK